MPPVRESGRSGVLCRDAERLLQGKGAEGSFRAGGLNAWGFFPGGRIGSHGSSPLSDRTLLEVAETEPVRCSGNKGGTALTRPLQTSRSVEGVFFASNEQVNIADFDSRACTGYKAMFHGLATAAKASSCAASLRATSLQLPNNQRSGKENGT